MGLIEAELIFLEIKHMTKVNVHFDNIKIEILALLDSAEISIFICMAWLTDKKLMDKLIEKLDQGLDIQICLLDHEFNKIKSPQKYKSKLENLNNYWADLKSFQEKNGKLNIVPPHLGFIHHKFAVIDNVVSITGSYNWSINAGKNKENIVVIEDSEVAEKFIQNFKEIVATNHKDIISKNFNPCKHKNCFGSTLKIRLIDYRTTTKYSQNDTYLLEICTDERTHISTIDGNTESDYIGDLIEYEYEQLNSELEEMQLRHKNSLINRRIESKIAWSLDSRLDVFVENGSHDLLGVYKITTDIDGFNELRAIWEHDLIKPYYIEHWENEIVEYIDN